MIATRTIWFPLRSNIAYFEGGSSDHVRLEERIKQACILADEVMFEPGGIDVVVAEDALLVMPFDVAAMEDAEIEALRSSARAGVPFVFRMAPAQDDVLQPEEASGFSLGGDRERGFFAEYHLLLRETGLEHAPWVRMGRPGPTTEAQARLLAAQFDASDRDAGALPALADNEFLNAQLRKDLNADLAASAVMRVAVAVDPLREPLLRRSGASDEAGATALRVLVPDFTRVPWKELTALHDHDAIGAFRAKLAEAEEAAAEQVTESDQRAAISSFGLDELARRAEGTLPSKWKSVGRVAAGASLDLMVGSFPIATAVAGVAEYATYRRDQLDWTTVLLRLKKSARS